MSLGNSQSDFDKSSTIPRNSDLALQYRKFAQSKRPASTVSLLGEPELIGQLPSHTATIRRKPSSKPAYRRGTISGGVPIPICTPQVPMKALGGSGGSSDNVFTVPSGGGAGVLGHSKLCTSTQSLSALPPASPYYQLVPGQMPIPVPVPTVPAFPPETSNGKQQQQINHQQLLQHQYYHQQQQKAFQYQQQQQDTDQQQLSQQQKRRLFQQQHQAPVQPPASQAEPPGVLLRAQAPPPSSPERPTQAGEGGGRDLKSLLRGVKLKRTVTDDRSAPLLPPPTNHKLS